MKSTAPDRHSLYQIATQAPAVVIGLIDSQSKTLIGRKPLLLGEDFCGGAQLSCVWALSDPRRQAVGVDNHRPTLAWAISHNLPHVGQAAQRVELVLSDVMKHRPATGGGGATEHDLIASLNFSHFIYQDRAALLAYFRHAHARLAQRGLLLLDAFGGASATEPRTDKRPFDGLDFQGRHFRGVYYWQQEWFDPITHRIRCHIHFKPRGLPLMERAFTYDWRLWTLPELRELLNEAGFDRLQIYFESPEGFIQAPDSRGKTSGALASGAVDGEGWVAYLVAVKGSR